LTDVRALRAAGHEASLVSVSGGAIERGCAEQHVPFVGGLKLGRGPARWLHTPGDVRRLRAMARDLKLDVLHVHRSDDQLLMRLAFGRGARPAVFRTWHRDPAAVSPVLRRRIARACTGCVCVARAHAGTLREAGAQLAEYVSPGVDTECFRPRSERGIGPPRLGIIGRWKSSEDRGQRAFLEVLRRLDATQPWRGVLLGRGEAREELERLLAEHPRRERLELVETGADFPAQVAALDLGLVFAVGSDGSSRSTLELLASGVPVLLADLSGLRELGGSAEATRLLPPQDFDAWARELARWIGSASMLEEGRRAARIRAEVSHALAVRGAALAAVYARG
jgi:glycosyltransferase involved in cell wall biosynthesis